jgi:hypothetical protein
VKPKGSLLVAQRELFDALFSNPSRARHDITLLKDDIDT